MHTDPTYEGLCSLDSKPSNFVVFLMIHDKLLIAFGDGSFWFLTDGRVLAHYGGKAVLTETHAFRG